jgi:rRNA maturation endonuclease Nob1
MLNSKYCTWSEDKEGDWFTSCAAIVGVVTYHLLEPMKFCPYCGKTLTAKPFQKQEEAPRAH